MVRAGGRRTNLVTLRSAPGAARIGQQGPPPAAWASGAEAPVAAWGLRALYSAPHGGLQRVRCNARPLRDALKPPGRPKLTCRPAAAAPPRRSARLPPPWPPTTPLGATMPTLASHRATRASPATTLPPWWVLRGCGAATSPSAGAVCLCALRSCLPCAGSSCPSQPALGSPARCCSHLQTYRWALRTSRSVWLSWQPARRPSPPRRWVAGLRGWRQC